MIPTAKSTHENWQIMLNTSTSTKEVRLGVNNINVTVRTNPAKEKLLLICNRTWVKKFTF